VRGAEREAARERACEQGGSRDFESRALREHGVFYSPYL
jgi:hypothetical protein